MAWTVILENENGAPLSSITEEFESDYIKELDFRQLKFLDPYGDTKFNHLQMDELLEDLNELQATDRHNRSIQEIISLANRCKTELHTYVVFYGD